MSHPCLHGHLCALAVTVTNLSTFSLGHESLTTADTVPSFLSSLTTASDPPDSRRPERGASRGAAWPLPCFLAARERPPNRLRLPEPSAPALLSYPARPASEVRQRRARHLPLTDPNPSGGCLGSCGLKSFRLRVAVVAGFARCEHCWACLRRGRVQAALGHSPRIG